MAEEYLTDDEQLDAVKRWVAEYAPVLIVGALLGVGGYFGYQYYETYRNTQGLKAAAQFALMTAAMQSQDLTKPRQIAEGLIKDFPSSPYADHARLAIARMDVEDRQDDKAAAALTEVMNNSKDAELKQIARLRLARVLIDEGKPDESLKTLAEGTPGSFAGRYHEVRGDALYAKKEFAAAITEYKSALAAGEASGVDSALLELKLADLGSTDKLHEAAP
jgi:predicted negative regulator of RcsB-dependent stress response